jgi:hypothetical protein
MSYLAPPSSFQPIERISQGARSDSQRQRYASFSCFAYRLVSKHGPMGNSPHPASIHVLDDDSLLHVFCLYRPILLGEDESDYARLFGGVAGWVRGRWWYRLAHVCQRWRNLILASASYLGVCLVCTYGTPVADMLAHSPPLPLVIDYFEEDYDIATEAEEGTILALKQRHRVRRIRLRVPVTNLRKLIMAIDSEEEYPILQYLVIARCRSEGGSTALILPETLQAPHLRHLMLEGFALPIGSRLLTTAVGLVTLCLCIDHPATYFEPNTLLQWISFMPQLETLAIAFILPVLHPDVDRQLKTQTPITKPITLPNLHHFWFQGACTYLEALVHRITTPRLGKLEIVLPNKHTISLPHLVQVMKTTENLKFDSARLMFSGEQVYMHAYPHGDTAGSGMYPVSITVNCCHLDQQVSSVAQISNSLSQIFSVVKHLTLDVSYGVLLFEEHNEVNRTEWRKLLSSFSNVKTFHIGYELVEELSLCLRLDDGELPLELLPELQELTYSGSGNTNNAFSSFIDARQNAGRPITLVRYGPSPDPLSVLPFETFSVSPESSDSGSDFDN